MTKLFFISAILMMFAANAFAARVVKVSAIKAHVKTQDLEITSVSNTLVCYFYPGLDPEINQRSSSNQDVAFEVVDNQNGEREYEISIPKVSLSKYFGIGFSTCDYRVRIEGINRQESKRIAFQALMITSDTPAEEFKDGQLDRTLTNKLNSLELNGEGQCIIDNEECYSGYGILISDL